jgi:leader peptidase (prepilin peptidase)/N-methyltransferase
LPSSFKTGEVIPISDALQLVGTIFAALLGLAFGSFLNVVVSRLPEGENIATPRSHCRNCDHTLTWWENLPILSWLLLRGRCRQCQIRISLRYPLIELAVGLLWTGIWLKFCEPLLSGQFSEKFHEFRGCWGEIEAPHYGAAYCVTSIIGYAVLSWALVALAALDAEHFWLPDRLTLPGITLGFGFTVLRAVWTASPINYRPGPSGAALSCLLAILFSGGIILIIRLAYWLIRRQEGMGLGDAKLMAMLGAWLGLQGALESFALAIFGALIAALVWLAILAIRRKSSEWAKMLLPLGTFLCLGALTEIFYPNWLWSTWAHAILNY